MQRDVTLRGDLTPRDAGSASSRRDEGRIRIAERGLASEAIEAVVRVALRRVPPSMVERARIQLRKFFSTAPWTIDDDSALAAIVGPGSGSSRVAVGDVTVVCEFHAGRLRVDVDWEHAVTEHGAPGNAPPDAVSPRRAVTAAELAATFEQPLVPEAGPHGRIVRFLTGPGSGGQSGWLRDPASTRDDRARALLASFAEVTGVMLGPGFVAIEVRDEHDWDELLVPLFAAVLERFVPPRPLPTVDRQTERARAEFAGVNPETSRGIGRVRDALSSPDAAVRQIAVTMVAHDDPMIAERAWRTALDDTNRAVRRAAVVAMAGVHREGLRSLLERALGEPDAAARLHAALGLAHIGADRSHASLERALDDGDARVRLAARAALASRPLP